MSRIHDALKKAAEEKMSRGTAGAVPDFVPVDAERRPAIEPSDKTYAAVPHDFRRTDSQYFLSFEELLKRCCHPVWRPAPGMDLLKDLDNRKHGAESFRTLRSRLSQIAGTRNLKRILVTSSVPQEGKTFVAANLARSLARQDRGRVLLIDADLRVPRLHQVLGAPATPGLTDYLSGSEDEYAVIQRGNEENLCFIPGGSQVPNPNELLLSTRMKLLLDRVTPLFDWLVLDSPPVIPVHDASLLADLCDGVLLVIRAGETDFELAEKASSEFRDKNLLGVVLNCAEQSEHYGGYYTD